MARVIVSAGHTDNDPGSIYQELREVDLTKKIAGNLIEKLKSLEVETIEVPYDLPMFKRIDWINNNSTTEDLLIEIHINEGDGKQTGFEAWYKDKSQKAENFGLEIMNFLVEKGYDSHGVKSEREHRVGIITFLSRTQSHGIIIECLYIDNPKDIEILRSDDKIANLSLDMANGIKKFVKSPSTNFGEIKQKVNKPKEIVIEQEKKDASTAPSLTKPNLTFEKPQSSPSFPPNFSGFPSFGSSGNGSGLFGGAGKTPINEDKEKKKQEFEELYEKVLGRKAKPNEVSFFVNNGSKREQVLDKMINSKEFGELIDQYKTIEDIKNKEEISTKRAKKLEQMLKEQTELLKKLNSSIKRKNIEIIRLQNIVQQETGMPINTILNKTSAQSLPQPNLPAKKADSKEKFLRRMKKIIS